MGVHPNTWSGSNCGVLTSLQGMQWSAQHGHVFGVEMKEGLAPSRWREIGLAPIWRWRRRKEVLPESVDEGEACSYQECWLWLRGGDEGWVVLLESRDGPWLALWYEEMMGGLAPEDGLLQWSRSY